MMFDLYDTAVRVQLCAVCTPIADLLSIMALQVTLMRLDDQR
jgi:hypothetical protein